MNPSSVLKRVFLSVMIFAAGLARTSPGQEPANHLDSRPGDAPKRELRTTSPSLYVHDPSTIVKCNGEYWFFSTGQGISSRHSKDLIHWEAGPRVFDSPPEWTADVAPEFKGIFWAPDVIYFADRFWLYYSVSRWGVKTSAIGLATNPALDPSDPNFHWTDHGIVIQTGQANNFNAIDPCVTYDAEGRLWMTFGSYWSGIKLIQLDPSTGKRIAPDSPMHSLAWHKSIEAACVVRRGEYYYLFVNWGHCMRGVDSTYNIRVGRSRSITGPYVDRHGTDLLHDGGSVFLATRGRFIGPGHAGVLSEKGRDLLSFHYYDGERKGVPTLAIRPLEWAADGWPVCSSE